MEDSIKIHNISEAEVFLKGCSRSEDIIDQINLAIEEYEFQSTTDLQHIKNDIKKLIKTLKKTFYEGVDGKAIWNALECYIFNDYYDFIFPLVKQSHSVQDLIFYEKCGQFSKENVSPKQIGSQANFPNSFSASVVEVSLLDKHKSPAEKLTCLCSTYDIMFAELKTALITMISKYSDKENDIPVINNEEVNPILMTILIRSKLMYFFSNLSFIKCFGEDLLKENEHFTYIFNKFEKAATSLSKFSIIQMEIDKNKLDKRLTMSAAMQLTSLIDASDSNDATKSIIEEEKSRIASLIFTSTSATIGDN